MSRCIGSLGGEELYCYPRSRGEPDPDEIMDLCRPVVERWSQRKGSDPGLVVTPKPPRPELYRRAVREIISKQEAVEALRDAGARTFEINSGRGLIGAAAAASWAPLDRTYEVLTYRKRERWGGQREVSAKDISLLDERFPSTFNNYDETTHRPAIIPHTSCPVLYGIRGDSPLELIEARSFISSEPVDRWVLFITNQGTDDHIIRDWDRLRPDRSYEVDGEVLTKPLTHAGGHVIFSLASKEGPVECAAYEPSKGFREVVRALRPGDRIKVLGELRGDTWTINLEKIQVLALASVSVKTSNPPCLLCGKNMKSMGKGQGYRCRRCGRRAPAPLTMPEVRTLRPGWYEPPVCSRRHLSKPLHRMGVISTIVV